jgi:cytochrome d ubiquinol oxidase subunit I
LIGFIAFYTFLLIIEMWLMFHFARKGPSSLGTGRYYLESELSGNASVSTANNPLKA